MSESNSINKLSVIVSTLAILVAILAVIQLIHCEYDHYSSSQAISNVAQKKTKIGYVVTTLSNPFFVDMIAGAKQEASHHDNVELVVQAPEQASDNERQIQMVESLISQKVSAICVVPADSKSIVSAIAKANAANIPVINVDNKVDADTAAKAGIKIAGFVGSDNFSGGKLAGQFVIEKLGGKGKVAILEGVAGVEAGIARKEGFLEPLKSAPGIKVVASQPADWSREKGLNVFQNIYKAHPDLAAVFAANDEMALGAARALRAPREVIVVGFDATKDAVDAVQRGEMDATVAQMPGEMGKVAVSIAAKLLKGEKTVEMVRTELKLVTKQ